MSIFSKFFGDPNGSVLKEIRPIVDKINALEPQIKFLNDAELKAKTAEFRARLNPPAGEGESLDDILPEAFAVAREASRRTTGMRHFDVQLIGGIVLNRGQIAEMRTGEGKTLVATLPVYLNALTGKGAHVVTVNDYLAKRDAVWMGQIYDALGLSVGVIQQQMLSYRYNGEKSQIPNLKSQKSEIDLSEGGEADKERDAKGGFKVEYEYLEPCSRQEAYRCDITYGTNNEFGFDYLRDNMVLNLEEMSQGPLCFGIVDEVDSILIDEARTPLIISAPAEKAADMYYQFADLVRRLKENEDYNVDEKMRSATLTEGGIAKMEKWLGLGNIYAEGEVRTVHHVEQALRAHALFKKDRDYIVDNGEIIIVDEFTGRKMFGRRYSEGLHQAIEAKEGAEIQRESQTMATITFQNYFRMYQKLAGMTGTAVTEAEEFAKIYKLEVVVIPPNKPSRRADRQDRIYRTEDGKFKAIGAMVKELRAKGQPALIGTVSVEKNEALGLYLEREGIPHEILNAKNHEREGEIIAQAGKAGAVTLATNMAGRGVDIILGGNPPSPEEAEKVREAGGLFVLGTERHESRRIDNQLRGRAGRQGDPGESQFYLSTEDDLMRIFAGDRIKSVMQTLRVPDDMPIEQKMITKIIQSAQKKVEGFHFDTRKHLLEYDDVLNRHREVIYGKRKEILTRFREEKEKKEGGDVKTLRDMILEMVEQELEQIVSFHTNTEETAGWNVKEIIESAVTIFPLSVEEKERLEAIAHGKVSDGKRDDITLRTALIEKLVEMSEDKYDELLVKKVPNPEMLLEVEKQILLRAIDNLWVEHLVAVDYLRTGIGLRGYGQRDPLVEYKRESFRMFNELLSLIQKEVVYLIYKVSVGIQLAPSLMEKSQMVYQGADKSAGEGATILKSSKPLDASGKEVGRNDPCPCGSGKKYKRCHGA
ncbi:MAG: Protein translocase subunit SecA [Candidatus Kaiserbacteria bacterium GW2011_GWA2_49_19]|uniref:Protein translocase subunit SecA n=1 Tax=Candidatus Kaiserbacteria bacterium GW2011_GWA2_49_19 TaxID=1618669 RepID=A0A0G1XZM8_9BACT|nr:MAG: Protein translocase subunit SecA [Candidatus Kaiserbacteria bacterium GW2011_GWA2_49_19]